MESQNTRGRCLARTFVLVATRYWITVWPVTARWVKRRRQRTRAIPDARLRSAAHANLCDERGNLEGAAAFAVLVPRTRRARLVGALVAFQAIYDFVDTLVEVPGGREAWRIRRLHQALRDALDSDTPVRSDYYGAAPASPDGGYLDLLVASCRSAVATLPSVAVITPSALAAVDRMIAYQVHIHANETLRGGALADWARSESAGDDDWEWWETAATAASSLVVFALLALAATDGATDDDAAQVVNAYLPVGAVHVLLDSFVDRADDERVGDHSLVAHYSNRLVERRRLRALTAEAVRRTGSLPDGATHELIVAAMTAFYLVAPSTDADTRLTAESVLGQLGALALPTITVLRARRIAARLAAFVPHLTQR